MSNTIRGREVGEGSTPKKRSKTRSTVWEHFRKVNDGTRAECNYCKNSLSYTWGTTTHLKRHLISCNKVPNGGIARTLTIAENNERAAMNQPPTVAFGEEDRNFDLTPEKICELQVKNAILVAFSIAPNFKMVWSNLMLMDMEEEIWAYHQREKDKLVAELGNLTSLVCFSFEIMKETRWISITAHFINDEFNLVKRLIGFKKLPDYTSELCADIIESCISDWKLGNKIFSFTTKWDDDLMGSFKEKFRSKMILDGDHDKLFIPCFKNAIVEFLSPIETDISDDEDDPIDIIKKIVTSPIARLKFNEIAEEKGLPPLNEEWSKGPPISRYAGTQDWKFCHSAVKIAKEALLYEEVLRERSLAEICQYEPDNISWTELAMGVDYFEIFNPIIDLLSNSKYPTSNLYCSSYETIKEFLNHEVAFFSISRTFKIMLTLSVACVLDPRYKLTFFEYLLGNEYSQFDSVLDFWPESTEEVREFFDIMFSRYAKEKPNQTSSSSIGTASTQECPWGIYGHIYSDPDLLRHASSYPLYRKQLKTTKREMDQYLREDTIDEDTNFDLLGWWKENSSRYPVLSRMVRDLLAIPACAYSVKDSLRIDLSALQGVSPELAEAVICSKNWILSDG